MKIVFMGTPDYAATALKALIRAGHEITAVVTQPDKARGRSRGVRYALNWSGEIWVKKSI